MSRIRTIKPEFWTSEQIMECSPLARLAFIGMWNFCDDNGVHPASCKTLKAEVFPGDDLTASNVQEVVNELLKQGLLAEFSDENRMWWFVTGWHHQLINRPSKSRYPLPPRHAPPTDSVSIHGTLTEDSVSIHGGLTEDSLQEGKGKEGKGRESIGASAERTHTHGPAFGPGRRTRSSARSNGETCAGQNQAERTPFGKPRTARRRQNVTAG